MATTRSSTPTTVETDVSEAAVAKEDITALWLERELRQQPVWTRNEALCRTVLHNIVPRWRNDYAEDPVCWNRIEKRLVKELNESEPFIEFILRKTTMEMDRPFVIVDVCSGFGIMSMLLSELLPPSKVSAIWLLDKAFALQGVATVPGRHITVDHLTGRVWPIPLYYRKVNIKRGRELRQLRHYKVFAAGDDELPVLMVGVHLCKSLSVHAIQLYHQFKGNEEQQQRQQTLGLLLKPCCLPGRRNLYILKRRGPNIPIEYKFANGYSFEARELYEEVEVTDNNDDGDASLSEETELEDDEDSVESTQVSTMNATAHTRTSNKKFSAWIEHLRRGCVSPSCQCTVKTIATQGRHFQNLFLFCETVTPVKDTTIQPAAASQSKLC